MALVTVHRSPTQSSHCTTNTSTDSIEGLSEQDETKIYLDDGLVKSNDDLFAASPKSHSKSQGQIPDSRIERVKLSPLYNLDAWLYFCMPRINGLSESYLAVKGAALILSQSQCIRTGVADHNTGDIQAHLQAMLYLLRPQDTIKMIVKLERRGSQILSTSGKRKAPGRVKQKEPHSKYLVLVSTVGRQDTEECIVMGVNINTKYSDDFQSSLPGGTEPLLSPSSPHSPSNSSTAATTTLSAAIVSTVTVSTSTTFTVSKSDYTVMEDVVRGTVVDAHSISSKENSAGDLSETLAENKIEVQGTDTNSLAAATSSANQIEPAVTSLANQISPHSSAQAAVSNQIAADNVSIAAVFSNNSATCLTDSAALYNKNSSDIKCSTSVSNTCATMLPSSTLSNNSNTDNNTICVSSVLTDVVSANTISSANATFAKTQESKIILPDNLTSSSSSLPVNTENKTPPETTRSPNKKAKLEHSVVSISMLKSSNVNVTSNTAVKCSSQPTVVTSTQSVRTNSLRPLSSPSKDPTLGNTDSTQISAVSKDSIEQKAGLRTVEKLTKMLKTSSVPIVGDKQLDMLNKMKNISRSSTSKESAEGCNNESLLPKNERKSNQSSQSNVAVKKESKYSSCLGSKAESNVTDELPEKLNEPVPVEVEARIGLVLPIWNDMDIRLDGDGGLDISSNNRKLNLKPVSVQALWSALQCLLKAKDVAVENMYTINGLTHTWTPGRNVTHLVLLSKEPSSALQCLLKAKDVAVENMYIINGLTHTWTSYYSSRINSSQADIVEWHSLEDSESHQPIVVTDSSAGSKDNIHLLICKRLKEIMVTVDLEEVTSKYLRQRLEQDLGRDLVEFKHYIDEQMIVIMRQMESPSLILDDLYLGSEWNASNLEELRQNNVGYILNVTREIDNFFPDVFEYLNIRVHDTEEAELLKHWDSTFRFVNQARSRHSAVLVHCKMGVSRSASTVIAYVMKALGCSLDQAYDHVKKRRAVIRPNSGFMHQLQTYEGILDARSLSAGNLNDTPTPLTAVAMTIQPSPPLSPPSSSSLSNQASSVRQISSPLACSSLRRIRTGSTQGLGGMAVPPRASPVDSGDGNSLEDVPVRWIIGSEGKPRSWSPGDDLPQLLKKTSALVVEDAVSSTDDDESSHTAGSYHVTHCPTDDLTNDLDDPLTPLPLIYAMEDWEELESCADDTSTSSLVWYPGTVKPYHQDENDLPYVQLVSYNERSFDESSIWNDRLDQDGCRDGSRNPESDRHNDGCQGIDGRQGDDSHSNCRHDDDRHGNGNQGEDVFSLLNDEGYCEKGRSGFYDVSMFEAVSRIHRSAKQLRHNDLVSERSLNNPTADTNAVNSQTVDNMEVNNLNKDTNQMPENSVDTSVDERSNELDYFLHPDVKMEFALSRYRREKRVARLLALSADQLKQQTLLEQQQLLNQQQSQAAAALLNTSANVQLTKVRPDDFWIRESSMTPDDLEGGLEGDQGGMAAGLKEGSPDTLSARVGAVCDPGLPLSLDVSEACSVENKIFTGKKEDNFNNSIEDRFFSFKNSSITCQTSSPGSSSVMSFEPRGGTESSLDVSREGLLGCESSEEVFCEAGEVRAGLEEQKEGLNVSSDSIGGCVDSGRRHGAVRKATMKIEERSRSRDDTSQVSPSAEQISPSSMTRISSCASDLSPDYDRSATQSSSTSSIPSPAILSTAQGQSIIPNTRSIDQSPSINQNSSVNPAQKFVDLPKLSPNQDNVLKSGEGVSLLEYGEGTANTSNRVYNVEVNENLITARPIGGNTQAETSENQTSEPRFTSASVVDVQSTVAATLPPETLVSRGFASSVTKRFELKTENTGNNLRPKSEGESFSGTLAIHDASGGSVPQLVQGASFHQSGSHSGGSTVRNNTLQQTQREGGSFRHTSSSSGSSSERNSGLHSGLPYEKNHSGSHSGLPYERSGTITHSVTKRCGTALYGDELGRTGSLKEERSARLEAEFGDKCEDLNRASSLKESRVGQNAVIRNPMKLNEINQNDINLGPLNAESVRDGRTKSLIGLFESPAPFSSESQKLLRRSINSATLPSTSRNVVKRNSTSAIEINESVSVSRAENGVNVRRQSQNVFCSSPKVIIPPENPVSPVSSGSKSPKALIKSIRQMLVSNEKSSEENVGELTQPVSKSSRTIWYQDEQKSGRDFNAEAAVNRSVTHSSKHQEGGAISPVPTFNMAPVKSGKNSGEGFSDKASAGNKNVPFPSPPQKKSKTVWYDLPTAASSCSASHEKMDSTPRLSGRVPRMDDVNAGVTGSNVSMVSGAKQERNLIGTEGQRANQPNTSRSSKNETTDAIVIGRTGSQHARRASEVIRTNSASSSGSNQTLISSGQSKDENPDFIVLDAAKVDQLLKKCLVESPTIAIPPGDKVPAELKVFLMSKLIDPSSQAKPEKSNARNASLSQRRDNFEKGQQSTSSSGTQVDYQMKPFGIDYNRKEILNKDKVVELAEKERKMVGKNERNPVYETNSTKSVNPKGDIKLPVQLQEKQERGERFKFPECLIGIEENLSPNSDLSWTSGGNVVPRGFSTRRYASFPPPDSSGSPTSSPSLGGRITVQERYSRAQQMKQQNQIPQQSEAWEKSDLRKKEFSISDNKDGKAVDILRRRQQQDQTRSSVHQHAPRSKSVHEGRNATGLSTCLEQIFPSNTEIEFVSTAPQSSGIKSDLSVNLRRNSTISTGSGMRSGSAVSKSGVQGSASSPVVAVNSSACFEGNTRIASGTLLRSGAVIESLRAESLSSPSEVNTELKGRKLYGRTHPLTKLGN